MALVEQSVPAPRGPSLVIQLAVLLVMTAAAVGMGWGAGIYLNRGVVPAGEAAPAAAPAHSSGHADKAEAGGHGEAAKEGGGHGGEAAAGPLLVDLAPMTTNLAAPSEVWIRLEASLVYDAPQLPEMAEAVHQDLLAYLRTLKMHQIEGSSGYQHLKADIQERAAIRSEGHVKQVLIRTLLFE